MIVKIVAELEMPDNARPELGSKYGFTAGAESGCG